MEKINYKDYRALASKKCKPYSKKLAVITLIILAVLLICSSATIVNLCYKIIEYSGYINTGNYEETGNLIVKNYGLYFFAASVLVFGPFLISLAQVTIYVNDEKEIEYKDVFAGFDNYGESLLIYITKGIFIILWSLLLIIPGIIKALSYSMAYFISLKEKELSIIACINKSRRLMKGHKWELFCLLLSYIGWVLLGILTCGVLLLWVIPKMEQAKYQFYLHLINEDTNK